MRRSERHYRTLFDSIDEGFCEIEVLFDDDQRPVDYRFIQVNPAFENQSGIQGAEGHRIREIAPDLEEHWFETYGRIALTGQAERFQNSSDVFGRYYDVYAFPMHEFGDQRVGILFRDVTASHEAELSLRQSRDELESRVAERTVELEALNRQLRHLAHELASSEHEERKRLAAHLHDDLQQLLVAATFHIGLLENQQHAPTVEVADTLKGILKEALDSCRNLTRQLRPPILYDQGLMPALHWLTDEMHKRHGLDVDCAGPEGELPLAEEVKALLFESVRELLFNVVKHVKDKAASVQLEREDHRLRVTVTDGGPGFDVEALRKNGDKKGLGLFGICERMEGLGGQFHLDSAPDRGTKVEITVPLA